MSMLSSFLLLHILVQQNHIKNTLISALTNGNSILALKTQIDKK